MCGFGCKEGPQTQGPPQQDTPIDLCRATKGTGGRFGGGRECGRYVGCYGRDRTEAGIQNSTAPKRHIYTDTESTNPKLSRPCATSVICLKVFCVTQICNSQVIKKNKIYSLSVELQRFMLLKLLLKDKTMGKQMLLSH